MFGCFLVISQTFSVSYMQLSANFSDLIYRSRLEIRIANLQDAIHFCDLQVKNIFTSIDLGVQESFLTFHKSCSNIKQFVNGITSNQAIITSNQAVTCYLNGTLKVVEKLFVRQNFFSKVKVCYFWNIANFFDSPLPNGFPATFEISILVPIIISEFALYVIFHKGHLKILFFHLVILLVQSIK